MHTADRITRAKQRAYVLALAFSLLGFLIIAATFGEAPLSPGSLSAAHQSLETQCKVCHIQPFRPVRALLGTDPKKGMNAACLDCHGEHIGYESATLEPHHGKQRLRVKEFACADCHIEHVAQVELDRVAEAPCARCHAQKEPAIATFAAGESGSHPNFIRSETYDDIALVFNHQQHLEHGRSTCSDCHGAKDLDGRRGAYMASVTYDQACADCHPIRATVGETTLLLPHENPAAVAATLEHAGRARGWTDAIIHQIRAGLYAEGGECARCHQILRADTDPQIEPVASKRRWYPKARFDHGQHTAVAGPAVLPAQDAECRFCHTPVLTSTRAAQLSIPGIDNCRACHAQGEASRCSTCHLFHEVDRPSIDDYLSTDPEVIAAGQHETRFGMRRSTPYWRIRTFFRLPEIWGRPDIKPQSEAFYEEVVKRYGLFTPDFENDGLPMGMVKTNGFIDGEPAIALTCEFCHSSSLFGQIVVGQPNPFASLEQLFRDMAPLSGGRLRDPLYDKNPGRNSIVNGADQLGLIGLIIHQPDMSIDLTMGVRNLYNQADALKPEFDALSYVKTPPWYTYRTKLDGVADFYYDGGHPKDGNFAAFTYLPSFQQLDGRELQSALADWMDGGHAFLASVEPPTYPFAIVQPKAARGGQIYDRECAGCHGHYDRPATPNTLKYPGLIVPIEEVGTDPKRARFPMAFAKRMYKILRDEYRPHPGYVAAPLTAIWARAPYLHNGSVPTLRALLRPKTRPRVWALVANPNKEEDFLQDDLGWKFVPLPGGDDLQYRRVYNPEVVDGLENIGHTYGADLSDEDVDALLEWLKTL